MTTKQNTTAPKTREEVIEQARAKMTANPQTPKTNDGRRSHYVKLGKTTIRWAGIGIGRGSGQTGYEVLTGKLEGYAALRSSSADGNNWTIVSPSPNTYEGITGTLGEITERVLKGELK